MSETTKAVFLSYASQDSEAAKRICESLRQAGVEVWFDQSELRGGDAWDQKIRKQIKECGLFVPIISANTNARPEGYFRLEWKLAVDRSHLLADDHPFLFPIAIGDANETTARVPDKFRDVQWTRLRLDETPDEVAARIDGLLRGACAAPAAGAVTRAGRARPRRTRWPGWAILPIVGTAVGLAFAVMPLWRVATGTRSKPPAAAQAAPGATSSITRTSELAQRASIETRDQLEAAVDAARRAAEKTPDSAQAWATLARLEGQFIRRGWDISEARRQVTQAAANRALAIDPQNTDAANALAIILLNQKAYTQVETLMRAAIARAPRDRELRGALGGALSGQGRDDEALAVREETLRLFPNDALAHYDLALSYEKRPTPDFDSALRKFEDSLALQRLTSTLLHKASLLAGWKGDLAGARQVLDQLDPFERTGDRAVGVAMAIGLLEHKPERAIETAGLTARNYFEDDYVPGPKAWYLAHAYAMAGKQSLASAQWREAATILRQRMAAKPGSWFDEAGLAVTLAWSGATAEAAQIMAPLELLARESPHPLRMLYLAYYYAGLGDAVKTAPHLRALVNRRELVTHHTLPLDPWWGKIRAQPEFAALASEARPRVGASAPARPVSSAVAGSNTVNPKSVVVLPFENLSPDPDNAYFTDGVHEDLLTNLTYVRDLTVVPRITTMRYRNSKKSPREIADELRIARIVTGSVRRSGATVRVTTQLIDARAERELWTWRRDYQLTDVFEVQNALALALAGELQAVLSPQERTIIARRSTESVEAYELLLKIREANDRMTVRRSKFDEIEAMGLQAVALDPKFGEAWAEIARARSGIYHFGFDQSAASLARVTEAIETAYRLAPDSPEVIAVRGEIFYRCHRDYARALEHYHRLAKLQPNNPLAYQLIGVVQRRQGRWVEAIESTRKAVELDPRWPMGWLNLRHCYGFGRRWKEALDAGARRHALENTFDSALWHALEEFRFTGSRRQLEGMRAQLLATPNDQGEANRNRAQAALLLGEYAYAVQLNPASLHAAWAEAARERMPAARELALAAMAVVRQRLERESGHAGLWSELAQLHAIRGEADDALRCARQAVAMSPESRDAIDGPTFAHDFAVVRAWTGDKDGALGELARVLRLPGVQTELNMPLSVHTLRSDPRYLPLRGDPRFEELINDPKHNAPLF